MGCATSSEAHLGRRRSPSPALRRGRSGSSHYVALTSSTLGSLEIRRACSDEEMPKSSIDLELVSGSAAMKAWSEMIEQKIPKAAAMPSPPPPGDPETINAWELMEGLEDDDGDGEEEEEEEEAISPRRSADRSRVSSSSRSANKSPPLKPLTPSCDPSQFLPSPESPEPEKKTNVQCNHHNAAIVKEKMDAMEVEFSPTAAAGRSLPPNGEGRVVVYSTSLRGVRKTHEDCSMVRIILRGYGILVDERDVSMHGGFKEELNRLIGGAGCGGGGRLPRIFASGIDLGGVEEVREMHEAGKLAKALAGCEMSLEVKKGDIGGAGWCDGCGDMRFVPCNKCSGSCKVFVEEEEKAIRGFRRCLDCNENGLIRCQVCLLR